MQAKPRIPVPVSRTPIAGLLGANAVSEVGNVISAIAIQWFALQTTDNALQAGLVGVVTLISYALAGSLGGALVDRVGFREMSVLADLASAVAVALIPLLYNTVGLSYWVLLLLVFLGALLDAPGATARQSLVPDVAATAGMSLERSNAVYSNVLSGASLAGPLLAGVLIAGIGVSQVLWINAVTFVVSAALIQVSVPRSGSPTSDDAPARGSYLGEVREGFQFIRRDPLLVGMISMSALANVVGGGMTGVALLVYADEVFGSATHLGVMYAGTGAGFLLGGVIYAIVAPRFSRRATLLASLILAGLPIWLLALTPGIVLTVALVVLRAAALGPIRPLVATILQERTPSSLRGRVIGSYRALNMLSAPLGILVAGVSIEALGLVTTLLSLAGFFLLTIVSVVVNPALRAMTRPQQIVPDPSPLPGSRVGCRWRDACRSVHR